MKMLIVLVALMLAFSAELSFADPMEQTSKQTEKLEKVQKDGGAIMRPKVFFIAPKNGDKVSGDIKVKFGVEGMKIAPAGTMKLNTGHHHLIVDGEPVPEGQVVPTDDKHIHFGKGQTETTIKLPPGKHTLTLQFANGAHLSYGPRMSATIEIIVE